MRPLPVDTPRDITFLGLRDRNVFSVKIFWGETPISGRCFRG